MMLVMMETLSMVYASVNPLMILIANVFNVGDGLLFKNVYKREKAWPIKL